MSHLIAVTNRRFTRERVKLDGHAFTDCIFADVTFRYEGGAFAMSGCEVRGFRLDVTDVSGSYSELVTLLMGFGLLIEGAIVEIDGEAGSVRDWREKHGIRAPGDEDAYIWDLDSRLLDGRN